MRLARLRRPFRKLLEAVVLVLMSALAVLVVAGVVFRKAGASLVWYDEVASILLVRLTYYGASLAALDRSHIGFPRLLVSVRGRLRTALVVAGEAVAIGFFVTVAWAGWLVFRVLEGVHLVSLPWLPQRLTQSVIPIGAVLFIAAQLLSLLEQRAEAPDPPAGEARPS